MLGTLFRSIVYLVLIVAFIALCIFAWVISSPASVLPLTERFTGLAISADSLQFDHSPLSIDGNNLRIQAAGKNTPLATIGTINASVNVTNFWTEQSSFWSLSATDTVVNVPEEDQNNTPPATELSARLPLDKILAFDDLAIKNLTIKQKGKATKIELVAKRKDAEHIDLKSTVTLSETGLSSDKNLNVQGTIGLNNQEGNSILSFVSPLLDITPLMVKEPASQAAQSTTETNVQKNAEEASLGWAWLGLFDATTIDISIDKFIADTVTLEQFKTRASFDGLMIDLENFHTQLLVDLADRGNITNTVDLKLHLQPLAVNTQGKDVKFEASVVLAHSDASVTGELNLNGISHSSADIEVKLSEKSQFTEQLPAIALGYLPLSLAASVSSGPEQLHIKQIKLVAGESDLAGNLSIGTASELLTLKGELSAQTLALVRPPQAEGSDETAIAPPSETSDDSKKNTKKSGLLIPSDEIDWQWLDDLDIDLSLTADMLKLYEAEFSQFTTKVLANKGNLSLKPFAAQFGGGGFDGDLTLKRMAELADYSVNFDLSGVDLEAFGLVSKEQLTGGLTDIAINLKGSGKSAHDLAASADGSIRLLVSAAIVQNDSFEVIGSDILMETLNKINPFAKNDPTTTLRCALVDFTVEDGVLTSKDKLVVETDKMEILGKGSIDLNNEKLSIGITPNAKQGVGLDVGSIVKFLKVGGTLAKPSPSVDAGGLLKSGASIGAAMSTGGLSLLAGKVVKSALSKNTCTAALAARKVKSIGPVTEENSSNTDTTPSTDTPKANDG